MNLGNRIHHLLIDVGEGLNDDGICAGHIYFAAFRDALDLARHYPESADRVLVALDRDEADRTDTPLEILERLGEETAEELLQSLDSLERLSL